jgi:preprotein translocase subunit SecG
MDIVLIVIHLMVVLAMIGLVLLQRSEGGALGIGGGGGGAFMTTRSAGNVLTTSTAFLATAFFLTSIGLALLAKMQGAPSDIFDTLPAGQSAPATVETPAPPAPATGTAPSSAEGMLEQLGGAAGPQTPPEDSGAATSEPAGNTPATNTPATNAPSGNAPATNAPSTNAPSTNAPAAGGSAGPQTPPADGGGQR